MDDLEKNWILDKKYKPKMTMEKRKALYSGWKEAVSRSLAWEK
jgi:glycerol kinase